MRIAAATDTEIAWLCNETRYPYGPSFRAVAAWGKDGDILGAIGFDMWSWGCCQCHIALRDKHATLPLLRHGARYVFEQLRQEAVLGFIPLKMLQTVRLARALGFTELGRVRRGALDKSDLVILELRREKCVWMRPLHREKAA